MLTYLLVGTCVALLIWLIFIMWNRLNRSNQQFTQSDGNSDGNSMELRNYITWMFGFFLLLGGVLAFMYQSWAEGFSIDARSVSTIILWCLAWYSAGSLLGFLFGTPSSSDETTRQTPDAQPTFQPFSRNLREVADWLTKSIAGITLFQARKIPSTLYSWAHIFSHAFPNENAQTIGVETIIYFSILGFLSFFFFTRSYLMEALRAADIRSGAIFVDLTSLSQEAFDKYKEQIREEILKSLLRDVDDSPPVAESEVLDAAKKIAAVSTEKIQSAADWEVWANSQRLLGNNERAIRGYKKAVQEGAKNEWLWLSYAQVLGEEHADEEAIFETLLKAERYVDPEDDEFLKRAIYEWVTFFALYLDRPGSYRAAIKFAKKYEEVAVLQSGRISANLAAAYGQIALDLKDEGKADTPQFREAKENALQAVRNAIRSDEKMRSILRDLWVPKEQKSDNIDESEDDLEVFYDDDPDNPFRKLLTQEPKRITL